MNFKSIGAMAASAVAVLALSTSLSFAMPKNVPGPAGQQLQAQALADHIGHWDATDVTDFGKATEVWVYSINNTYSDSKDIELLAAAEDAAGTLGDMHKAFAANADVEKWFKDNGYLLNDMMAIIHVPEKNAFVVYLH